MVFMLVILWVTVGVSLVIFTNFINDKPKIAQENNQYLTMSQAAHGLNSFINNSANIVKNSNIKVYNP